MKPLEGIIGPGMTPNDCQVELPDCIQQPKDLEAIQRAFDQVVRATNRNAVRVARELLSRPGQAKIDDLLAELGKRLGV